MALKLDKLKSMKHMGITIPIIVINIVMYLLQQFITGFTDNLLLVSADVWVRPWILLSSMFLHGSPAHLFFNMYALFLFGPFLESRIGTKRFTFIYLVSGILAGIAASFFYSSALGASGAIMGILGVTIMLFPNLPVLFFFVIPMNLRTAGLIIALIDIVGLFPGVAHMAHLAGLAAGLLYGWYLVKKRDGFRKRFTGTGEMKRAKVIKTKTRDKNDIFMSDNDVEDYIQNGRI
jgi:membrane associated rhomboid family serine protease